MKSKQFVAVIAICVISSTCGEGTALVDEVIAELDGAMAELNEVAADFSGVAAEFGEVIAELTEGAADFGELTTECLNNSFNFTSDLSKLKADASVKALCYMTTDQLIKHYGYEVDSFTVTTEDGYILRVFRCYSKAFDFNELEPIILQHGMMDSSDSLCINPGVQSMAYYFASKGYLVYLPNSRGNRYSRLHTQFDADRDDKFFWNFSWYEMGIYDLPAVIDFAISESGNPNGKIPCIGHSQGGTIFLVLLSMRPEYNEKISLLSLLAPFTFMKDVGFPISAILKFFNLMLPFRNQEFAPNSPSQQFFSRFICKINCGSICNAATNFVLGPSRDQKNDTMMPVYFCRFPAGCSVNQLIHFGQELKHQYFGGPMMQSFLSKVPDDFPLDHITANVTLHYSPTDPHTSAAAITKLKSKLSSIVDTQEINDRVFNHVDFIWGIYAHEIVYSRIHDRLKNMNDS